MASMPQPVFDHAPVPLVTSRRPAPSRAEFSPLEWLVIAIARRDTMASIRKPGRLAIALGSLFGSGSASSLADPHLEELRYAAVLAWHGREPNEIERQRFLDAGFGPDQHRLMCASVSRAPGGSSAPDVPEGSSRAASGATRIHLH